MKIERMNKGSWGKVRAFFDLTTQEGFTIKGFKLIEGINGIFVSMPSQKGNDGEYRDTIWLDSKSLKEKITSLAMDYYNNASDMPMKESNSIEPEMTDESSNMGSDSSKITPSEAGDNLVQEGVVENNTETFKDEDIPF